MGPSGQRPPEPALEWTEVSPGQLYVSKRLQECNYLQAMEGGIGSSHVSWLHGSALQNDPLFAGSKGNQYNEEDRMPLFEAETFDGGILIGARRNAENNQYYWRITPWIMPWYSLIPPAPVIQLAGTPGSLLTIIIAGRGASITTPTAI